MRIAAIESFSVSVPLSAPVVMANQQIDRSRNVLVRVSTDEGIHGWGEAVAAPRVTGETRSRIQSGIEELTGHLIGEDPLRRSSLWHRMQRLMPGNESAVGAIDIALHDLAGRAFGVRVVDLLGGAVRESVPALTLVGGGDPDAAVATVEARLEAGYRWFKLKLGVSDPATEEDMVRRVADLVGDGGVVCADANEGWTEQQAAEMLDRLGGSGLLFLEQPVHRSAWASLGRLTRRSPVPLCADESMHGLGDLPRLADAGVAGVNLKLIKQGGITGVMRGALLCEELGLGINVAGKVAETSIAAAANLHCAAAMESVAFGCSPGHQGIGADVTSTPPTLTGGEYPLPKGPGLGIDVDEDLVRALADD